MTGTSSDRRDEDANRTPPKTSSHAVTDPDKCYEMEAKYGWRLLEIQPTKDKTLEVECIFEGETEFPNYMED